MFNNIFEHHVIYEKIWKNIVQSGRPQMTIRHMCTAYWIPRTTNTHSEYITLNTFPLQQWLQNTPQHYVIRTLHILLFTTYTNISLQIVKCASSY